MNEIFIAYLSERIVVEWYCSPNGRSQPLEYYQKLSSKEQGKLLNLFGVLGVFGSISEPAKFRFEGDGIFAFKVRQHWFYCFFAGGSRIIITNAYRKKRAKGSWVEKRESIKSEKKLGLA